MFLQELAGKPDAFFSHPTYLASSAMSKMSSIWPEITADENHGSFPPLADIMGESMHPTFETKGDVLPPGRLRYIHGVAGVGQVALKSNG